MKFSVVIPLYNKAPYIEGAIKSVLGQTFADLEIIVVDDGSNDGGGNIVDSIEDPRLRMVRQNNQGVSAARNKAISMAKGDWVVFLDADDWHHPSFLETLVTAQNMRPDVEVVATTYLTVPHSDGAWPPAWSVDLNPGTLPHEVIEDLPARWIQAPTLTTSSVAAKTSLLGAMQPCFVVGESCGEDVDLWFRLGERTPILLINAPLVAYRVAVNGSLSANIPLLILPPYLLRLKRRAKSGDFMGVRRYSTLRFVGHLEITMAREALAAGKRLAAIELLLGASNAGYSVRWWSTICMAMLLPGNIIRHWQDWRVRRTLTSVSLS